MNEKALSILIPDIQMDVVEINSNAAEECRKIPNVTVYNQSLFDFCIEKTYDLTFTSGVMIHLAPEMLDKAYDQLYKYSHKYILVSEYYSTTPTEIIYRGNEGKLYKRDFAGEMMEKYSDLEIVDYGFIYRRSLSIPAEDDITYFLLRKS